MTQAAAGLLGSVRIAGAFDWAALASSGAEGVSKAIDWGKKAAVGFATGFKDENDRRGDLSKALQRSFENIERLSAAAGKKTAESFMGGINAVMSGNPGAVFDSTTDSLKSFIETTGQAGQVVTEFGSMLGPIQPLFEAAGVGIGIATTAMGQFVETGGAYLGTIAEIGDAYLTLRRTLAASTLDMEQVNAQMVATQEIMASGAVDHFDDVSQSIARFQRSLGLSGTELRDFTETYAAMAELIGTVSPTNIAGVLNAFAPTDGSMVDANGELYDYNEQLTRFTNIIRATGGNAQSMVDSMIRVGPAMRALGFDSGGTALFFGGLLEKGLRGQKLVYGMNQIVEQMHDQVASGTFKDLEEAFGSLLTTVQRLQAAGRGDQAIALLSQYTTPANATLLNEAIAKGIIGDAEEMGRRAREGFDQGLAEQAAETADLGDIFENIQQQLTAAIAPVGLAFNSFIVSGGNKLVDWLDENQVAVATWAKDIANFFLEGFQFLIGGIGDFFQAFSVWVNPLVEVTVTGIQVVWNSIRLFLDGLGKLGNIIPDWLGGDKFDVFRSMADGMGKANEAMDRLREMDLSKPILEAGNALDGFAGKIPSVMTALDRAVVTYGETIQVRDAFKVKPVTEKDGTVVLDDEGNPELTEAFGPIDRYKRDAQGNAIKDANGNPLLNTAMNPMLQLTGDPTVWEKVKTNLKQLGIEITIDATKGIITNVETISETARKMWEQWYNTTTKAEADVYTRAIDPKTGKPLNPDGFAENLSGGTVEVEVDGQSLENYVASLGLTVPGIPVTPGGSGTLPSGLNRPSILTDQEGVASSAASVYAASAVAQNFPQVTAIGGGRRSNTAKNTHDIGQAIDIAIPQAPGGGYDMALGDKINAYLKANAEALNIRYTIWRDIGEYTKGGGTFRSPGHMDHIDVQFNDGSVATLTPNGTTLTVPYAAPNMLPAPVAPGSFGPAAPVAPAASTQPSGGGDIQSWLYGRLLQSGLSPDQARGILAMNAVEGGATNPKSILGFVENQQTPWGPATGPEGHLRAFLGQWNDMSRRGPNGEIPGVGPNGVVTDWEAFMTWIRVKILGQTGVASDWQGNAQPAAAEYQRRLMEALRSGGTYTPWNASAWPAGTTPAFIPQPQLASAPMPAAPVPAAPWTAPVVAAPAPSSPIPPAPAPPAGPTGPTPPATPPSGWQSDQTGKYWYYQDKHGTTYFADKAAGVPAVPENGVPLDTDTGHWQIQTHGLGGKKYWLFLPNPVSAAQDSGGAGAGSGRPPAPKGPDKPKPLPAPGRPEGPGLNPGDPSYDSTVANQKWLTDNFDGKVPAPIKDTLSVAGFDWTKGTKVPPAGMEYGEDGRIVRQGLSDDQKQGAGAISRFLGKVGELLSTGPSDWLPKDDYARPENLIPAIGRGIANSKGVQQAKKAAGWLWENMFASGGPVFGPGTATSDSIPAWLSHGEFVHNAAAVQHYGLDFMHALNARRLPKFDEGGDVTDISKIPPLDIPHPLDAVNPNDNYLKQYLSYVSALLTGPSYDRNGNQLVGGVVPYMPGMLPDLAREFFNPQRGFDGYSMRDYQDFQHAEGAKGGARAQVADAILGKLGVSIFGRVSADSAEFNPGPTRPGYVFSVGNFGGPVAPDGFTAPGTVGEFGYSEGGSVGGSVDEQGRVYLQPKLPIPPELQGALMGKNLDAIPPFSEGGSVDGGSVDEQGRVYLQPKLPIPPELWGVLMGVGEDAVPPFSEGGIADISTMPGFKDLQKRILRAAFTGEKPSADKIAAADQAEWIALQGMVGSDMFRNASSMPRYAPGGPVGTHRVDVDGPDGGGSGNEFGYTNWGKNRVKYWEWIGETNAQVGVDYGRMPTDRPGFDDGGEVETRPGWAKGFFAGLAEWVNPKNLIEKQLSFVEDKLGSVGKTAARAVRTGLMLNPQVGAAMDMFSLPDFYKEGTNLADENAGIFSRAMSGLTMASVVPIPGLKAAKAAKPAMEGIKDLTAKIPLPLEGQVTSGFAAGDFERSLEMTWQSINTFAVAKEHIRRGAEKALDGMKPLTEYEAEEIALYFDDRMMPDVEKALRGIGDEDRIVDVWKRVIGSTEVTPGSANAGWDAVSAPAWRLGQVPGSDISPLDIELFERQGAEILARIVHSKPTEQPVWRGMRMSLDQIKSWMKNYREDSPLGLPLSSFISDFGLAQKYAVDPNFWPEARGLANPSETLLPVVVELAPGAQMATIGRRFEELLTQGRFNITDWDGPDPKNMTNFDPFTFYLEQTGLRRAGGGPIFGEGSKTSDSIAAWLSNGEFVHSAAAVDYYGKDFMHALNQRKVPKLSGGGDPNDPSSPYIAPPLFTPSGKGTDIIGGEEGLPQYIQVLGDLRLGSGAESPIQAPNSPFLYPPKGERQEVLAFVQQYVAWQEEMFKLTRTAPKELADALAVATDEYQKAAQAAQDAQQKLDKRLADKQFLLSLPGGEANLASDKELGKDLERLTRERDQAVSALRQRTINAQNAQTAIAENEAALENALATGAPQFEPKGKKGSQASDKDAESLGAGLIKGIFEGLGFPDVFGDAITEWGIYKLAMGGLGYGINLAQAAGVLPALDGSVPNGGLGPGTGPGLANGAIQTLLPGVPLPAAQPPGQNVPVVTAPASVTPAMAPSGTPVNDPIGLRGTGPLPGPSTVVYNNFPNNVTNEGLTRNIQGQMPVAAGSAPQLPANGGAGLPLGGG